MADRNPDFAGLFAELERIWWVPGEMQAAIKQEAGRDFDGALALMEKVSERMGDPLEVTYPLMDKGISLGADEFLRVIAAGMRENGSINEEDSWFPEYSEDFDFKAALDGIVALEKNAPEGQGLSAVPNDLLQQWMKNDPEAATEWFLAGNRAIQNGVTEFFLEYSETATSQEVGALAAKLLDSKTDGATNHTETWNALSRFPDRDVLLSFLAADTVRPHAAEHARDLLHTSMDEVTIARKGRRRCRRTCWASPSARLPWVARWHGSPNPC